MRTSAAVGLLGLLLLGGCQSGAQSDLVARELRMQEDKIYAMEDYLAEYQRLLRQCRAENASLRQQLSKDTTNSAPLRQDTSPPVRGDGATDLPLPEVELPPGLGVPGLGEQSSTQPESSVPPQDPRTATLHTVSHAEGEPNSLAAELPEVAAVVDRVWLRGEVWPNDAGGPRLLVDVAPLSRAGRAARFDGNVSLMVLADAASQTPKNLARWDFSSADAQAAMAETSDGRTMRFRLELPASVPLDRPVELWLRLVTQDGEKKMLASAPLDLQQGGQFVSVPFQAGPSDAIDSPVVSIETVQPARVGLGSTFGADEGWTIVRPGETRQATANPAAAEARWRPSSEALPALVESTAAPRQQPPARDVDPPVVERVGESMTVAAPPAAATLPTWSPDRAGEEVLVNLRAGNAGPSQTPASWSPNR